MVAKKVESFVRELNNGHLIFFAGSGISFDSNIPSASEVLSMTSEVFFPALGNQSIEAKLGKILSKDFLNKNIISAIEPEILYEKLLWVNQNDKACLDLWKSLAPSYWPFQQRPTVTHFFLVAYSIKYRVPIFTTNFDILFESALSRLRELFPSEFGKVKLELIVPTGFGYPGIDEPIGSDTVRIVKLHGTIGSNEEDVFKNLMTTLTSITGVKLDFLEYLSKLMDSKSLAIVGYSGGDIDIFPYLRSFLKDRESRIYWIGKFSDPKTRKAALSLERKKRVLIRGEYPEEFFKERYQKCIDPILGESIAPFELTEEYKKESRLVKTELLERLQSGLRETFNWSVAKKLLFAGLLYDSVGLYRKGYQILDTIYKSGYFDSLSSEEKCILLTELCSASHNNSMFPDFENFSNSLIETAREQKLPEYEAMGILNLAEYQRMRIPFDTFLFEDNASLVYSGLLLDALESTTKKEIEVMDLISRNNLGKGLTVDPLLSRNEILGNQLSQSLIDFEIRKQAIKQVILKHLWKDDTSRKITGYLAGVWNQIEKSSKTEGYASGIIDSYKFLTRIPLQLDQLEANLREGERFATLLTHETALQLLQRNRIEIALSKRKVPKNRKEEYVKDLMTLYYRSINSGNRMNGIKALLGICETDRITGAKIENRKVGGRSIVARLDSLVNSLNLPLWSEFWKESKIKLRLAKNV